MYATNLIVAHDVAKRDQLYFCLANDAVLGQCEIKYGAKEALDELYYLSIQADDCCLELHDPSDRDDSGIFLSSGCGEQFRINNRIPLPECFQILKTAVELCLDFSSFVEVFITSNRAEINDYSTFEISPEEIPSLLSTLFNESTASNEPDPDIHLLFRKNR